MDDTSKKYIALKKAALERYFSHLNDMQKQAVLKAKGPVLILAGAGSGKTTVIVNRIASLIRFGDAYHTSYVPPALTEGDLAFLEDFAAGKSEDGERLSDLVGFDRVYPYRILAITFTNKAAGELKERLGRMLGQEAMDIQASTFHSACVRILRREIHRLGYSSSFTIYDTDDSLRVIKEINKELNLDDKMYPARTTLSVISQCKDKLTEPDLLLEEAKKQDNYRLEKIAAVYKAYQRRLKEANAVDFDDILVLTVRIFQENPDALEYYQNRYRYIMVDEYQDTNHVQYLLVSLLASGHQNLCVVGDDDQSIYKFRGANIENILSFESQFPGAMVIRLEQNYRCTKTILDVANKLISNNQERKGKTLWTDNAEGEKVQVYYAVDESEEARYIADQIMENVREGHKFSEHAVLYRMNAQSNALERALVRSAIPYRVISGVKFYERKEIKDVLAYLNVINNSQDRLRLSRIVNEPKRGIGDATMAAAEQIAEMLGISLFEVLATADEYAPLSKKAKPLMAFAQMMKDLMEVATDGETTLAELFDQVLEKTGYMEYLRAQGPEGQTRVENVEELKSNIESFLSENPEGTLGGFLEEVALYTDLDSYDPDADNVVLMTLHSAKGLEYRNVFIAGMEEGIFPGIQSMYNPGEVEEERRLAYVGFTRAKQQLTLTHASQRMLFGQTTRNRPSRFLSEVPEGLVETEDQTKSMVAAQYVAPARGGARTPGRGSQIGVGQRQSSAVEAEHCEVGQRVRHRVFGEGVVDKVTPMGNDQLLEVIFDTVGLKKIMSNFAKLEILQ